MPQIRAISAIVTQKELGERLGFPKSSADIRVAQYEFGKRSPKEDMINSLAEIFGIKVSALTAPDIDSQEGVMEAFFAIEDMYGVTVKKLEDGNVALVSNGTKMIDDFFENIGAWAAMREKYSSDEISEDEYNHWRYKTSKFVDDERIRETAMEYMLPSNPEGEY